MGIWQYIFIGLGVLLLATSVWQQYKRGNKKNLLLRLLASIIATISLTCLGLTITYKKQAAAKRAAIITTGGYSNDSVHAFTQNKVYPSYTFKQFVTNDIDSFNILHVFGHGLSDDELKQLHNAPIIFHPQSISTGITNVHWQPAIQAGEQLRVQGSYNNTTAKPIQLQLNGLNTLFDSLTIPANTTQNFELITTPSQSGKAVYSLTSLADNKVIEEEPVPFEVLPHDTLSVIMLASSPNFENKFLKNWLADNGYHVTVRNTTSKEKFSKDFLNIPVTDVQNITNSSLLKYDALISDASEFTALSKDEQYAIQSAVENGMGLVVTADTALPHSFYSSYFPVYSAPSKPLALHIITAEGSNLSPLPIQQLLYIRRQPGMEAMSTDSVQQLLSAVTLYGVGKAAVNTLNNTYNWLLSGNKENYYAYWSGLLSNVVRNINKGFETRFSPALPVINEPLHITVQGSSNQLLTINNTPVYLAQNVILPYEWDGTYWPTQTGWHTIKQQGESSNFYVYANTDWPYVQALQKINATKQYAAQHQPANAEQSTFTADVPVSKMYFFIIFLLACTFLWIERKFNG